MLVFCYATSLGASSPDSPETPPDGRRCASPRTFVCLRTAPSLSAGCGRVQCEFFASPFCARRKAEVEPDDAGAGTAFRAPADRAGHGPSRASRHARALETVFQQSPHRPCSAAQAGFLPSASVRADDEILPPQSKAESISAPTGRFNRPAICCPSMTRGFFFRSDFPAGYSAASE